VFFFCGGPFAVADVPIGAGWFGRRGLGVRRSGRPAFGIVGLCFGRFAVGFGLAFLGNFFLAGRTELTAFVAEHGRMTVRAVPVRHRRPLQEEFAHPLGGLAFLLVAFVFLA
jgi:hypothetical protein